MELNTTNQIIPFIKQKQAKYCRTVAFFQLLRVAVTSTCSMEGNLVQLYPLLPSLSPLFLISLTNQKLETRNKNHSTMLLKTILSIGKWGILFKYK